MERFSGELEQTYPGNRVVFSCRTLDYSVLLSPRERPVRQVRIESLSDAQVEEFITLYCPEHGAALWQNLKDTPQLDLLRSPYYLKLLVAQTTTGDIPAGRAALFTALCARPCNARCKVGQAVSAWCSGASSRCGAPQYSTLLATVCAARKWSLLPKLSALAWQMQTRRLVTEASQVRVAYDEALQMLDHPDAEDILKAGARLACWTKTVAVTKCCMCTSYSRNTLLRAYWPASRNPPWYSRNGVRIGSCRISLYAARLADADPCRLCPARAGRKRPCWPPPWPAIQRVLSRTSWRTTWRWQAASAAQPEVAVSEALKATVRGALVERTQDARADLRARIAAGLALGALGDPRFARRDGPYGTYLLPPLIEIPGGTYQLGSDEGLYADEAPVHSVVLAPCPRPAR